MSHYRQYLLADDCFTIDTRFLQTLYVLLHPTGAWMTQQAWQLIRQVGTCQPPLLFLIHDRDRNVTTSFEAVFTSEPIKIIRTPYRAPNAYTYADRWAHPIREVCLDKLLILNETHLRRVMCNYIDYYNQARSHQGIAQQSPIQKPSPAQLVVIRCPNVFCIINDCHHDAA
ncbi:MAG: integrase [Anaerolineae bacterium]